MATVNAKVNDGFGNKTAQQLDIQLPLYRKLHISASTTVYEEVLDAKHSNQLTVSPNKLSMAKAIPTWEGTLEYLTGQGLHTTSKVEMRKLIMQGIARVRASQTEQDAFSIT